MPIPWISVGVTAQTTPSPYVLLLSLVVFTSPGHRHIWQSCSIQQPHSTIYHAVELSQSMPTQSPPIIVHNRETKARLLLLPCFNRPWSHWLPWLEENRPTSLTDTNYKKWLKELKLPQPKADTLEKNLQKVMQWCQNQPDTASKTIQRVSVAMSLEPHKRKNSTTDGLVIKVVTVALTVSS